MSDDEIPDDAVRALFVQFASAGDRSAAPQPLAELARAQLNAFGDAMRDLVDGAAASDHAAFRAALEHGRQIASATDLADIVDALHVPEDAGEYEPALTRLLVRIPDGWGRWISCSSGWYALLARAARELAEQCPTFEVHQIKEKFGTLRLYVEFDHDDDLPEELRAAEPRCPSMRDLAEHVGIEPAGRDGPLGDAWQAACDTIFTPAFSAWSARVDAFRASEEGMCAAEQQQRRAAAFEQLVTKFEAESATTCERCGGHGALSCSPEPRRWYAVRCDQCREVGWMRVADETT